MVKNEFDEFSDDEAPPVVTEHTTIKTNSPIAAGSPGTTYDWTTAPDGTKAPPRIDLNGQIVGIRKADIILPPIERPWDRSKKGDKELKNCSFIVYYDQHSQQESYSGVRVFKKEENGEIKYSHPTITRDRKNQSSQLLGKYADFVKKDINEISLRQFMNFLNSGCKAKLIKQPFTNPETGAVIEKNMVDVFVNP